MNYAMKCGGEDLKYVIMQFALFTLQNANVPLQLAKL